MVLLGLACAMTIGGADGCTGSGTGGGASGGTLTIGMAADVTNLDPAKALPPVYDFFAYDTLIHRSADDSYVPDLATSWRYVGSGNKTIHLTLRRSVRFDDGTTMTADAVAASMNRFLKTPGAQQVNAGPVADVTAVGPYTVEIRYRSPVPYTYVEQSLDQDNGFGMIIGPKGLANPTSLTGSSDGVGEYTLDPSATTAGAEYTYVPNPRYYNQAAIKYDKVVLKPMPDAASRLSAIESGQIDWAKSMPSTDQATGKSAGLHVQLGGGITSAVLLEGSKSGPLASQAVRQAIAYAVPRQAILKAIYAGGGTVTSTVSSPGEQGYDQANSDPYPYNPARARQLLTQAGYSHGFTLSVLDSAVGDPQSALAQALASALSTIGISLQIHVFSGTAATYVTDTLSRRYQVVVSPISVTDIYTIMNQDLASGTTGNAFDLTDAVLNQLLARASGATTIAAQSTAMQQASDRLDQLAWVIPIVRVPGLELTSTSVKNVPSTYQTRDPDPVSPVTADNWSAGGS
jgi:peptide/nickel transport system substrate-binding protein